MVSTNLQLGTGETQKFPFDLSDLVSWTIRRRDGTAIKYSLVERKAVVASSTETSAVKQKEPTYSSSGTTNAGYISSLSRYCTHNPAKEPIFYDKESKIGIYQCDYQGGRNHKYEFDYIIDGGNVIDLKLLSTNPILEGDQSLCSTLLPFAVGKGWKSPRVIQVDWDDRKAPPLRPEFWPALAEELTKAGGGKVMTLCQGGHGRSGTSSVCLMMALTNYTPLEAIVHLRAIHCARAIESKEQKEYINSVGALLGRKENALESYDIPNFKEAFLKSKNPIAKVYQERLK